jgi:hypothetical protein
MKFENIVVGGITNIVINRKAKWTLSEGMWQRENKAAMMGDALKSHDQMMEVVNHLKADHRYRMWVHGNTLNVVRV